MEYILQFDVTLVDPRIPDSPPRENKRGPKVYKVKLKLAAEINPEYVSLLSILCSRSNMRYQGFGAFP